jgi:HEPN domain-containing protein
LSEVDPRREAQRWRQYAQEDLDAAAQMARGEFGSPRLACMLAQQAAEKAIKAVLVREQISFPKTHDLDRLRNLLPSAARAPIAALDLSALSEWAVESRYPGDWPEVSTADAVGAVETTTVLLDRLARG